MLGPWRRSDCQKQARQRCRRAGGGAAEPALEEQVALEIQRQEDKGWGW